VNEEYYRKQVAELYEVIGRHRMEIAKLRVIEGTSVFMCIVGVIAIASAVITVTDAKIKHAEEHVMAQMFVNYGRAIVK